jgi:hypothetical protein
VESTAHRLGLDLQAYLNWKFARRAALKDDVCLPAALLTPAVHNRMVDEHRQKRVAA